MVTDSRANKTVKHMKRLGLDRRYRHDCREFLCDGIKLLEEAISAQADITEVLSATDLDNIPYKLATQEIINYISPLDTPQSVVFSVRMPERCEAVGTILLDRLQDPGNMGTIIRCADAFGIDSVVTDGCVDVYNPKTVRAAMGGLFRVGVTEMRLEDAIDALADRGVSVYASYLDKNARTLSDFVPEAVVIGNEANGVRDEIAEKCAGRIFIPMSGMAQSLNAAVACSIFMWEMTKKSGM